LKRNISTKQGLLLIGVAASLLVLLISPSGIVNAAAPLTVTFDFDTGTPTLYVRQPTSFNQTVTGVTANFSSPTDLPSNPAFSVQTLASLATTSVVINSTHFSGLFLWPSTSSRDTLFINFSQALTNITLWFKTAELHDPGPGGTGSPIRLTAYANSTANQVGLPVAANGNETLFDTYPEGILTFNSSQPFNIVQIDLPFILQGASGFIIDNVTVTTSTAVIPEFPTTPTLTFAILLTSLIVALSAILKSKGNSGGLLLRRNSHIQIYTPKQNENTAKKRIKGDF
jgi:hypothetical protein